MYNRMDGFSKKEDNRASLEEIKRSLEEWDIRERIDEKIDIWGIRYSEKKIAAIPIKFISNAIVYYFCYKLKAFISNYTQTMLMNVSYHLKCIYNSLAMSHFKRTSSFQFSLVILAKLTHYFITSRYSLMVQVVEQGEIENDLYRAIVNLLIGYEVDSKAYQLIQKKYKQTRKNSSERKDSFRMINDLKLSFDLLEKAKRTTKKIHRNGIKNLLQKNDSEKSLETFRVQVHQALHIKKTEEGSLSKSEQKKRGNVDDATKSTGEMGWLKGKNKLLNINQVSAAMSIYMGNDPHNKAVSNIHLSKRRIVKEHYFGNNAYEKQPERVTMPLGEMTLNSNKNKDWSLIVESLKQKSQHLALKQPKAIFKKIYQCNKNESIYGLGTRLNQLGVQSTDDRIQKDDVDFRKLHNAEDQSIYCVNGQNKNKKQIMRKSSSTFFVRDRSQFQKSCAKRKQLFQSNSIYFPKLQKL